MEFAPSLPAYVSVLSGVLLLGLAPFVWRYRDRNPSVRAYTALLGAGAVWALSYGVALTVFDPGVRRLFEIPIWFGRTFVVLFALVAGFRYSGHDRLVPGWASLVAVVVAVGVWLLHATNALGVHTLMWDSYTVEPVLGAAAVSYEPTPLTYLVILGALACISVAYLLVIETVLRYGPLYRIQAVAILVWSLPPVVASAAWVIGLGPWTPVEVPLAGLDMTPPSLLLTGVVLAYILFVRQGDLLEISPASRRAAESVVVDDVGAGVVIVSHDETVLGMNETAEGILGTEEDDALGEPVDEVAGVRVRPTTRYPRTYTFTDDPSRTYRLSVSEVARGDGGLGYILNIQDVTEQRRRQQRLEVLNRVLRHNLRNDMVVIKGNAEDLGRIADEHEGELPDDVADSIRRRTELVTGKSEDLVRISEKAREISEALPDGNREPTEVDVVDLVGSVVEDVRRSHGDASIRTGAEASEEDIRARADPRLLRLAVENLVENAVVHGGPEATVDIRMRVADGNADGGYVRIEVSDDGPGIPDHEVEAIESGGESPLEHGSGMGLWVASWAARETGGGIGFSDDGTGTTVTVTAPAW